MDAITANPAFYRLNSGKLQSLKLFGNWHTFFFGNFQPAFHSILIHFYGFLKICAVRDTTWQ